MAKFRKKPVIIEAFQYGVEDFPPWFKKAEQRGRVQCFWLYGEEQRWCEIETPEGTMRGESGDWIIRGIHGEIYPYKPDIFEATYELVEGE